MSNYEQKLKGAVGEEWFELLKDEFNKQYFINLSKIINEARKSTVVYPNDINGIFSVFRNTPPSTIKCVVLGQDPYPDGSYDGMAFSNKSDTIKISPSLENIFKEIENDIFEGFKVYQEPNLTRWQKQGVFLINRVLTVQKGAPRSHSGIGWEHFTGKVISIVSELDQPIVFMLWGNDAKAAKKYISNKNNLVLESGHPSPLSANRGYWFGNKHFSKANKFLIKQKIKPIEW